MPNPALVTNPSTRSSAVGLSPIRGKADTLAPVTGTVLP